MTDIRSLFAAVNCRFVRLFSWAFYVFILSIRWSTLALLFGRSAWSQELAKAINRRV